MASEHGCMPKVTDLNDKQLCRLDTSNAMTCTDDERSDVHGSWRAALSPCGRLSGHEHMRVILLDLHARLSDYFNLRQILRPAALRASTRRWHRMIEALGSRPDLYRADTSASRSVAG